MNPILREDTEQPPPVEPHIDCLCRLAELQGGAWARAGYNVRQRLRHHTPHWPGDRRDRMRLIAAALAGAGRRGGRL